MRIQELKKSIIEQINKIDDEDFLKLLILYMDERKKGNLGFDLFGHYKKIQQNKNK